MGESRCRCFVTERDPYYHSFLLSSCKITSHDLQRWPFAVALFLGQVAAYVAALANNPELFCSGFFLTVSSLCCRTNVPTCFTKSTPVTLVSRRVDSRY